MTRAEVEAILAGTQGVTPMGPWKVAFNDEVPQRYFVQGYEDDNPDFGFEDICEISNQGRAAKAAFIARLDPQTVASLCQSLLSHIDRVEAVDRHIAFLDRVIETNIRDNGVEENRLVLRDGTVLTGRAVDICYGLLRSIQSVVQEARKALAQGGSDERS